MRQNEKQEEWIVPIGGSEKITGGGEGAHKGNSDGY